MPTRRHRACAAVTNQFGLHPPPSTHEAALLGNFAPSTVVDSLVEDSGFGLDMYSIDGVSLDKHKSSRESGCRACASRFCGYAHTRISHSDGAHSSSQSQWLQYGGHALGMNDKEAPAGHLFGKH